MSIQYPSQSLRTGYSIKELTSPTACVIRQCLVLALLAVLILGASPLWAQHTVGTIVGTVTAPDGSVIVGATVTVTNEATTASRTVTTNKTGDYAVPALNPGAYTVSATAPGFAPYKNTGIELRTAQTLRIDLPMTVGSASTRVVVTVGQPVVNSQMSSISQTLTPVSIQKSSTNLIGTNIQGVGDSGLISFLTDEIAGAAGSRFSPVVYGSTATANFYNTDGISAINVLSEGATGPAFPSFDMVQEVTFNMVNNEAQFREPAVTTVITRSGTNHFHGDVFLHNVSSTFAAYPYFATSKPSSNLNLYGGGLGGPIAKNRLFFFAAFEGMTDTQPQVLNSSMPTLAMRGGNFSALLAGPHPTVIHNPYTGQPFPGNIIPPSMLTTPQSTAAQTWQTMFFPDPNFGPPDNVVGNLRGSYGQYETNNRYDLRLDANTSPTNTFFVRFSYDRDSPEVLDSGVPPDIAGRRVQTRWVYSGLISDTWVITPNLFNVAKVGMMAEENDEDIHGPLFGQPILDKLGVTGFPIAPADSPGIPTVSIDGFTTINQLSPQAPLDQTFQYIDQINWQHGNQIVKAGFEYRPMRAKKFIYPNFGTFSFTGGLTGYSYADFLLGLPQQTQYSYIRPPEYIRLHTVSAFVQDDWRITPNLTLNLGVRYDYDSPAKDRYNRISSFNPANGAIVVPSVADAEKFKNPFFPPQIPIQSAQDAGFPLPGLRNGFIGGFAPRVGFAYAIGKNTVLKGGYGLFISRLNAPDFEKLYQAPYGGAVTYVNNFSNGTTGPCSPVAPCSPAITFTQPVNPSIGALGAINQNGLAINLRNPYAQQTNLTVEQNIGFSTSLALSYIGTFTRELPYGSNINQVPVSTTPFNQANTPYPLYQTVIEWKNGGNQNYNALNAEVHHRMKDGLLFDAELTWAKNLTDDPLATASAGNVAENAYNLGRQYGNGPEVPRVAFTSNLLWTLPVGQAV